MGTMWARAYGVADKSNEGRRREWSQLIRDSGHFGSMLGPFWDIWGCFAIADGILGAHPIAPYKEKMSLVADEQ